MARGKGAGVAGAPSRGRRREPRRLALPRAPGASGFAAAPRPVPTPREARAFVPFEAFAAVRAGAAEVCGSGEARARRRREGRGRRQRVRSRDSTRARRAYGARRLSAACASARASVWIEKSAGLPPEGVRREDPEPHGSRRTVPRAGTAPSPGMALVSRVSPVLRLVSPPGEKPRAPLFARAAREMRTRREARDLIFIFKRSADDAGFAGGDPAASDESREPSIEGKIGAIWRFRQLRPLFTFL